MFFGKLLALMYQWEDWMKIFPIVLKVDFA